MTFTADMKEMIVVIKNVPATVCSLCGNEWLSDDVAGQIECIVQDAKENAALLFSHESHPLHESFWNDCHEKRKYIPF